jgi:hypothetical protein
MVTLAKEVSSSESKKNTSDRIVSERVVVLAGGGFAFTKCATVRAFEGTSL